MGSVPRSVHTGGPVAATRQFAQACMGEDMTHTSQVTRLSLSLFDELTDLHGYSDRERLLLECAALLHDIGWVQGWKGHHKSSLQMIQDNQLLPFESKERLIIGSIARYHRKALPSIKHDHYAALDIPSRKLVVRLAAILRIADGLDRTHTEAVKDLHCYTDQKDVVIRCVVSHSAILEEKYATEKSDLFEKAYKKKIVVRILME